MNKCLVLGSAFAILLYFPLWWQIKERAGAGQNFLTWALWFFLDVVAAASLISKGGNFLLAATYTVGSFITILVIRKFGEKGKWTWFESVILALVFLSMGAWCFLGNRMATITSTTAMFIAGIPLLVDTYKKPKNAPFAVYLGYIVASCLSVAGGREWSVEERFYPATVLAISLLAALFAARKFLGNRKATSGESAL
ncbi:MAG: hypothetical protein Q7S36_01135 [Candidatus Liptonbacteria bacterium]|nr:hypothetical protein [Candidatus Liptonbacteria bacterium]